MSPNADLQQYTIAVSDLDTGQHETLAAGVYARYSESGHLLVVRSDGALFAAPFDLERLGLTGPLSLILEGVRVRGFGVVDLAISNTGTLTYVAGEVQTSMSDDAVWIDRDGATTPVDATWRFDSFGNSGWAVSPDGSQLAIKLNNEQGQDIYIKDLRREGPPARLTFYAGEDFRPRWSPDGRSVLFVSDRAGQRDLYRKRVDGTGTAELVLDMEQPIIEGLMSNDGNWVVVRTGGRASERGVRDIWAAPLDSDTVPIPLLTQDFDERAAALSPDGLWLAYESNESGSNEVHVRQFPDVEASRWQISTSGGHAPLWSRDGNEIFYLNPQNEMIAAEVTKGPGFVGERRTLFTLPPGYRESTNYTWFDVAPDGRFLLVRLAALGTDGGATAGELIVVENFFEELKAKVGN